MVPPFIRQSWTVSAILLNMVGQGMLLSYTSSLLPGLQDPESTIKVDLNTASWLASSCGIACIPGFFISSFLMNIYGRKITHLVVIQPGIIGWLAIYFAQNVPTLMIGRILGGVTAGATVTLGAIVIGEYTHPKYRGIFLNLKTSAVCLGGMLVHIFSHYLNWRIVALIAVLPYSISCFIICTWPESPAWLASRGEFDKSEKAFFSLRENSVAAHDEIQELIRIQRERLSKPVVDKSFREQFRDCINKFTRKDFLRPLFIVMVSFALLDSSGRHVFPAYAQQIIGQVTGNKTQSFYYTLVLDVIITSSTVCSSILVRIMKRRTLLLSTGFAAFGALMVVCTYLALGDNNVIQHRPWVAIGMFIVFFILANLGCTPIPLALLGEIFPLRHRELGSSVVGIFMSLALMLFLQVTPYLLVHIKVYGTFFIFGSVLGLSLLILYFILPETKDKTLQEIENYFNYGTYKRPQSDGGEKEHVPIKMFKN